MTLPRWIHRLYARWFGYFWLPCRGCGRDFGGHEIGSATAYYSANQGWALCKRHTQSRWIGEGPCPHVASIGLAAPIGAETACHYCGERLHEYRGIWAPWKYRDIAGVVS